VNGAMSGHTGAIRHLDGIALQKGHMDLLSVWSRVRLHAPNTNCDFSMSPSSTRYPTSPRSSSNSTSLFREEA
jgi:hypothetical protein